MASSAEAIVEAKWVHPSVASLSLAPVGPHQLYINGRWQPAAADATTFNLVNPATEQVITSVPNATTADVDAAVRAAKAAFDSGVWSGLTGKQRGAYLRALAAKVTEHKKRLADLESLNCGKPWREADWDISDVAGCFLYFAQMAEGLDAIKDGSKVRLSDPDYTAVVRLEPLGVVGAIVPWNYPLLMATWKLAPALAAGCTIVLKPSELCPLTTLEWAHFCTEVGIPAGVVNIVTGEGHITGNALIHHPLVDKLAFTGSVPTGVKVMQAAAPQVKRLTLELGGKSSAIVMEDVDIEKTVEWVMFGCFWTNGQICSATSRLLIHESIADAFIARLVAACKKIPIGDPLTPDTKIKTGLLGPIVSKRQHDSVLGHIKAAIAEGAIVLTGGSVPAEHKIGYYIEPTVLRTTSDSKVWHTEIFGPVLSVCTFSTEEEAIRLANDTEFGLAGAIFSADEERCQRVIRALRVGVSWINCSQPCFSQLPWGGMKKSGFGRDLGEIGLKSYLEPKQVVSYTPGFTKALGWYDMTQTSEEIASAAASVTALTAAAGEAKDSKDIARAVEAVVTAAVVATDAAVTAVAEAVVAAVIDAVAVAVAVVDGETKVSVTTTPSTTSIEVSIETAAPPKVVSSTEATPAEVAAVVAAIAPTSTSTPAPVLAVAPPVVTTEVVAPAVVAAPPATVAAAAPVVTEAVAAPPAAATPSA